MDKDLVERMQKLQNERVYLGHDEQGNYSVVKGDNPDIQKAIQSGQSVAKIRVDNPASISLDKKTGKITVSAPDRVINNETFKKSLDPVLKSLSLNYKLAPDYKYALINTEEGKENVKTTEEWVKELNDKDLPSLVSQTIAIEDAKQSVKEKDGVDLTDEQIIKMSQTGTNYVDEDGKEHLAKDTDMVAIPKSMFEGKGLFAGIKGWDENTHMITRKDLLAKYDRTKSSDEDILDVFKEVDDYFKKGDFSDADEYAEMSSLRSFINGQDPNTDFLHNIKDFGEATVASIGTGGYGLLTDAASFIEGALNVGRRGVTKASLALQGRGDEINDKEVIGQSESVFFKELSEEKDKWENSIREDYAKLSDVKAGGYSVGSVALPLVGQIALAVVTGGAASGAVGNTATKIASKWGAKAVKLGSLAEDAITASQNAGKVANLARNAYAGTEIALTMSNPAIANTAISESINALRIANRVQTIGKVTATGADLAAQITVDVALSNPRLARQFLDGNVTDENKAYMYEQLAWNVGGWGAGAAGMKAFKAVGSSDIGKVANAAITPKMYGVQADIGQRIDDFKTLLHKGDPDWLFKKMEKAQAKSAADVSKGFWGRQKWNNAGRLERKQSVLTSNRLVREAKRTFSQQDSVFKGASSWDDLVENAKRIKNAQVDTVSVANLLANKGYKVNVQSINERLASENTAFRSARDSYMDQLAKVNKLEDASKLARAGEASLSDDVNKYVNAMHRMDQANAELRLGKVQNQLVGAQKELDHLQEVVDGLRRKLSPELRQEADNLLMEARKLSGATQDLRVSAGVLDEDELAAMRNSGYFDHGYLRQQRVQEWNEYTRRGEEGIRFSEMRDPQHFNWGNTEDDWQDLSVVLFDDINQVSRQVYRKEMTDMLEGLGHKVDVVVSGKDVAMVRKVSPLRKEAIKSIDQNTKKIVSAGDDDVFSKVFQKKDAESLINTQASKTVESGGKVAKAESNAAEPKRASKTQTRKYIANDLSDHEIEEATAVALGKPLEELTEDEYLSFLDNVTGRVRDTLADDIGNVLGDEIGVRPPKESIPVLDLDEYKTIFGYRTYNDVPKEMKPFLKRGGVSLYDDSVTKFIQEYEQRGVVRPMFSTESVADKQRGEEFLDIIRRPKDAQKELVSFERFKQVPPEALSNTRKEIVSSNYGGVWEQLDIPMVATIADNEKRVFDAQTLYKENIEKLNALKKQYDIPEMNTDITKAMDDLVNEVVENNKKNTVVSDALKALDEGNADDLVEYATLKSLSDKSNLKEAKASLKAKAKREFNKFLTENNTVVKDGKKVKKLTGAQIDKLSKQWADEGAEWLEETIMQRYGNITNKLRESGSDIVDTTDVFSKIDALNQEITGAAKRSGEALNVIKTYDGQGREEWVELSPTIADMITTMPRPMARGAFGELQQHLVRLFRMGTTGGLVPSSFIRQGLRDPGSALTGAGAIRSIRATEREFERIFGEYLGDTIRREMPNVWDSLLRESQETGETMARTFARRETARGAANIADSQLESSLYRFTQNAKEEANAYRYVDRATGEGIVLNRQNTNSLLDWFQEKAEKGYNWTEFTNNARESYLRKRTYNNALQQGLADGMGLERARKYAEFIQAEATTNFGRQTYYLANLTKTVPYLGAAINGAKSFWRLWAFDPVGVTTRIIGGYVVPSMALLAVSLGDPENRRIYESIPEYEKTDNLIFVVQGQKFTIPIPQEVSSFIRPLQSMVESMAGANDHSLTELLVNDLVGFMPLNLEGFVNIDADRILLGDFEEDPAGYVLRNHLMPGFTKMSSQLMPPLVKSGYILATGYDPYTGKKVDTSYTAVDPETGESIVMGGNTGDLAKGLAFIFGDSLSPQMAQAVLGNLLGSGNMDIIDGITGLVTATAKDKDFLSGVNVLGDKLANQVTKPLFSERYNEQSNLAWNRATGKLRLEKKELMNDEELQADIKAINTDNGQLSEKARKEILGRIRSKTEGFQRKVIDAADDLVKNYDGGIIDKNKLATVLDLATFSEGENLNLSNMYAQKLEREEYNLANAAAIESLANLGFKGAGDSSIFGYYKKTKDGNVEFVRNDPMTILNYERSSGVQDKMALAEIESLAKEAGLWDKHDAIYKQINKIRGSKKKLSKSDFAAIDAIKINWNAELMKTLAPVVKRMTPEAAINNKAVRDFLYSYVEVPGEWSVNNKGRHPSLGERGSTKGAYYQSWLKSMYGIKDQYKGQY